MRSVSIEGRMQEKVAQALKQSPWFKDLETASIDVVLGLAALQVFEPDELIVRAGGPSDSFFLLIKGEIGIEATRSNGESVELGRVQPPFSFGEVGLLLGSERTATVVAIDEVWVLSFQAAEFRKLFDEIPGFRLNVARGLAGRLQDVSELVLPQFEPDDGSPDGATFAMLPLSFIQRHRLIPLNASGNSLTVGFVEDPTPQDLAGVRQQLPGMEVRPVRISAEFFRSVIDTRLDLDETQVGIAPMPAHDDLDPTVIPAKLQALIERMCAEGASDLHLAAGRKPVWRVDGDMRVVEDGEVLGPNEAYDLLKAAMEDRHHEEFDRFNDADFGLTARGYGRFRVNLYRTKRGINAALRQIPWKIMSLEQLGLPAVLRKLCAQPKGLVLVTGPTGSGKSTTLAAMIDHINRVRNCHVVTLEDPIEFVHEDNESMVNQREVGAHAESFARGLRAALREDPDVVLLGEIRDAREAALALEIANTGHLVFATLHTNSAISSIERVVDMFPSENKNQVRNSLADSLRGVVSQVLVKARTGGRVAAVEVLVGSNAVANLIKDAKTAQLANIMQVGRKEGNQLLNDHLAQLVRDRRVLRDEAIMKTVDPKDLGLRLSKKPAEDGAG